MRRHLFLGLGLLLGLWQTAGQASPYIVLFQQNEIGVGSLSHNDYQNALKSANAKNLTDLQTWMNGSTSGSKARAAVPVQDLWLVRGAKADLTDDAATKLKSQPFIAGVYPDEIRHLVQPVGEMKVSAKLDDTSGLWGLTRIGIPQLRAQYPNINGSGVRVGIIDTGIQAHHPEFTSYDANGNPVYTPVTFQDFVNGMTGPYDDHGHGTHVSGTIAGQNVGIAPGVSLIVGKALNASGEGYDSWLLAAMQWMMNPSGVAGANDWAQVVSSSWGADISGIGAVIDITQFAPYQRAIESWIAGGIVPIFAAGNSGTAPNGIPGGLPDAIAIGAIDNTDAVASFSSRGPNIWQIGGQVLSFLKPDLSAPGVNVTSSFPGNSYATWSGTSMATPHVTGSVALALQADPKLTYSTVKTALYNSVDQKIDVNYGYGILNAYHLVQNILSRR